MRSEIEERRKNLEEMTKRLRERMTRVKHKIVVMSGKGGVGKSTFTANLALAFSNKGYRTGILDADIHGPSIPKILGVRGRSMRAGPNGALPVNGPKEIKIVSMDFLLTSDETPVIWRGPLKDAVIRQFLSEIDWGELDLLLVDLPPGTGDEPLSVMQQIPGIDGVLLITVPSEVSQLVVRRAVGFVEKMGVPILGIVENMSGFVCPKCGEVTAVFGSGGGKKISDELGLPFLGSIPLDPRISEDSDEGRPFILERSGTPAANAFARLVEVIEEKLKEKG